MKLLSEKLLKDNDACTDGIDFVVRNKLIGYPLSDLHLIVGDYMGYVMWLKHLLERLPAAQVSSISETTDGDYRVEHVISPDGKFQTWGTYGEHGLLLWRDSNGYSSWSSYNTLGQRSSWRDSEGSYHYIDYDGNGNICHKLSGDVDTKTIFECWIECDDRGNNIHYRTNEDYESWRVYNAANKMTQKRDSNNSLFEWEYDDLGNTIHHKDHTGYWHTKEYDGMLITSHQDSNGLDAKFKYDIVGNLIKCIGCMSGDSDIASEFYDNGQLKSIGDCYFPLISTLVGQTI